MSGPNSAPPTEDVSTFEGPTHDDRLWYDAPASEWVEALPVGNGRLGGMVHGRPARERVALNDDRLWTEDHADRTADGGPDDLAAVRECLWEGEVERAQRLCNEFFVGDITGVAPYQPLGDLLVDCPGHGDPVEYRRSLDLRAGVSRVEYTIDGTRFERECFASAPDGVLAVRIAADEPGAVDAYHADGGDDEERDRGDDHGVEGAPAEPPAQNRCDDGDERDGHAAARREDGHESASGTGSTPSTGTDPSASSTMRSASPSPTGPPRSARMRWANTGGASACTSSGTTNSRPARTARPCAARRRAMPPRGLTPSAACSRV